jgi:hypothetical protein
VYPHSLSYFNESIGGPLNGAEYLLGSNVDWGQDLRYLIWWLGDQSDIESISMAYYGSVDPSTLVLTRCVPVDQETLQNSSGLETHRLVLSCNILYDAWWPARDGNNFAKRIDKDITSRLRKTPVQSFIGPSILVFKND